MGADLVESIRRIKARKGPDLIVAGSISLISALLVHGLADEVVLLVNPIALGKGKRLFEADPCPADSRWAVPGLCRRASWSTSTS